MVITKGRRTQQVHCDEPGAATIQSQFKSSHSSMTNSRRGTHGGEVTVTGICFCMCRTSSTRRHVSKGGAIKSYTSIWLCITSDTYAAEHPSCEQTDVMPPSVRGTQCLAAGHISHSAQSTTVY